jgi:hypothetical protein
MARHTSAVHPEVRHDQLPAQHRRRHRSGARPGRRLLNARTKITSPEITSPEMPQDGREG